MSLNTSPYPRVPCSACPTEICVQQRTTTNTEPGWQPTGTIISSFHCTSPVRWLGNCVLWQGEVCYGMVAKQIKEREIKSRLKWNTAQASVLLGSGWDPQGSLQTGIQFLSFSARSVNAPNSTLWQKLLVMLPHGLWGQPKNREGEIPQYSHQHLCIHKQKARDLNRRLKLNKKVSCFSRFPSHSPVQAQIHWRGQKGTSHTITEIN